MNSSVGKLFRSSQRRCGTNRTSAARAPIQNHFVESWLRNRVNNKPPANPMHKNPIEYLLSNPKPATIPNQTQSREFPVTNIRITTYRATTQNRTSKEFMEKYLP